jgi:hypothetical protein
VTYLDSSVALARLLDEPRSPPASFWVESMTVRGESVALATYDNRLAAAARALGIPLAEL